LVLVLRVRSCAAVVALTTAFAAVVGGPATAGPERRTTPRAALASIPAIRADSIADGYGVGVHLAYSNTPYADADAVASAIADLGVRHVRDDLYLSRPDQYAAMATVVAAGARFDLIMGRPDSGKTPADYVSAAAALPTGTVESLEGANEWDYFGPPDSWASQVTSWQQDLYAAAKAEPAAAGLPVLSPALAFKQDYAALGDLSASADVANMHVYPGGTKPTSEISQMTTAVRAEFPNGPLITTEAGYHNATEATTGQPGVPEKVAGFYLPRLLLEHLGRGERMYSYELIDEANDPTNPEASFGLLHHDLTPKPAYTAMKNLLALVSDPGPGFTTTPLMASIDGYAEIPGVRYLLTQKRDGSYVLLVWRDVSLYDTSTEERIPVTSVNTTVRVGQASRMQVFQPSAGAAPIAQATGTSIPLSLGGQVVAVRIDALERPGRPVVSASSPRRHQVRVRWSAPSDHGHPITRYRVKFDGVVTTVDPDVRRLVLRGLPSGHSGRATVSARNSDGWGPAGRSSVVEVR
jgi:hypothetical protein